MVEKKVKIFLKKKVGQQKRRRVTPKLVGLNKGKSLIQVPLIQGSEFAMICCRKMLPRSNFSMFQWIPLLKLIAGPPQKWWLEDTSSGLVRLLSGANRSPARELSPYPENHRLKSGDC